MCDDIDCLEIYFLGFYIFKGNNYSIAKIYIGGYYEEINFYHIIVFIHINGKC